MKIIKYTHEDTVKIPKVYLQYFENLNVGIFDIETTGLKPADCRTVLCGIMEKDPSGNMIQTQYFLESPTDENEKELMLRVIEHLNTFDFILTYNGRHFDIPFMNKRAGIHGISPIKPSLYNLDLYLIINGHCGFKHVLKNLKQATVEEYVGVGITRKDEISGKESVELYYRYVECTDPCEKEKLEEIILLHNHDDILQLYKILPVLKQCNMHSAMFKQGFPCGDILIKNIRLNNTILTFEGVSDSKLDPYDSFLLDDKLYSFRINNNNELFFEIPVQRIKSTSIVNLRYFGELDDKLNALPGYVNGFLILSDAGQKFFKEINSFIRELVIYTLKNNYDPIVYD